MLDLAKEARDLKHALAENAYPAADGSADLDNHALPIIEATLRSVIEQATSRCRRALQECAAPLSGGAHTAQQAMKQIGDELQRRIQVAGAALEQEQ